MSTTREAALMSTATLMSGAPPVDRGAQLLLGLGLAVGLVCRLCFAALDDGLWWPDEYYQSFEPAHRLVFGYGFQAWEFLDGARHWTLPGLVAGLIEAAQTLGLPYRSVVRGAFCLAGSLTAVAVYGLARAQGAAERSAATASFVFSVMGLAVFMAPRAMGEGLSALPVTVALALLVVKAPSRRQVVLAGLLLSLAVGLRLQNGLFCLGGLWLVPKGSRWALLGVLLLGAALYGAIDALTWGSLFHSARAYLQFNLVEGRASAFGTAPFFHYLAAFVTAEGLTMVPLVALAAVGARRSPKPLVIIAGFLLVHSLIPHKELRFVFPVVPVLCAQAALGLEARGPRAQWALMAVAVLSLVSLPTLTFGRLGISNPPKETSALDYGGPENRLLVKAGALADVCGLRIESIAHWRTGGFAWFHRRVPLYGTDRPNQGAGHFNYVIAKRGSVEGAELAVDHDVALVRVANSCSEDATYDWHLE
jgi:hypothetical protein